VSNSQQFQCKNVEPSIPQDNSLAATIKAVWVLAGSAGAGVALQQFLNAFSEPPPVAFIYAQHFDPATQDHLQHLTAENPLFTLTLVEGTLSLKVGHVLLVPPKCKVEIGADGEVSSTEVPWEQTHTPDIEDLLIIFSAANFPDSGVIYFSGMGSDGVDVFSVLDASGVRLWAQAPETAVCGSMPQCAINTGLVHRIASPEGLANELTRLYL